MRAIPIIFSGPMVLALLSGRKTMTRRLAMRTKTVKQFDREFHFDVPSPWQKVVPGDRLYVRENFAYVGTCDPGFLTYQATYPKDLPAGLENVPADIHDYGYKWTPCIHMPRKLSRLMLIVQSVKVERLQAITNQDARAEGAEIGYRPLIVPGASAEKMINPPMSSAHTFGFEDLWKSLHGSSSWADNPQVVALTFTVHKTNIDQVASAA